MPDLLGIGSAIQGIGQTISSAIDAKTQRQNTDKTIQANKAMAEYQYSKDLEMWNRGNTYNAPSAQMERLKQAGLNPNLVYGNGAQASSAGQLPKYNAPTVDYNYKPPIDAAAAAGGISGGIMAYQDMKIKQAQIDNLRAQRLAILAGTANKEWQGKILENREMMSRSDRDYYPDLIFNKLEKARLGNELLRSGIPYQLQGLQLKNDQMAKQNLFLMQQTENKRLQNEYYLSSNFGLPMAMKGGSMLMDFLKTKWNKPTLKATKPALRVNPNNWPKFKR